MPARRLQNNETEKPPKSPPPPPIVQTESSVPEIRPKEPKLTLRLRLKQEAPCVVTAPTKSGKDAKSLESDEKWDEKRGPAESCKSKDALSQSSAQIGRERTIESSLTSRTLEQDSNVQVMPPALRSPAESNRTQLRTAPRVSFEKGTRQSSAVPKGIPCCVHPKLIKNGGKCTDAACQVDRDITIDEVEQLLGIKIDQFINDEAYERMRSRIENLGRTGLGPVGTSSVNLTPTEQSTASKDEPPRQPKAKNKSSP
ncbi:uncharacterized protein LOC111244610 isoform X1 [Varroa destructor]|uniref:Uncharacterized protein n=1 Tax=Varroa destructor TaxID=109461 RepID=A0A7M7MAC8_VARDE|nr:uncharacterized protein LOC111244610 isoform X1 [Varroa destructor]